MAIPTGAGPRTPRAGIVVGVDGSPGSLAALRWAIREAAARGLAVHAVTAWDVPTESTFGDMVTVGDFHPVIAAERILVAALADAGAADNHVTVTTAPVQGHPAEVLMQQAERAELLVIGTRGHGRIVGALLGSVSQYLAAHATCPVVVIKPLADRTVDDPVRDADAPASAVRIPYLHRKEIDRRGPMAESMDLAATRELAAHRAELPEDPRSRAEFLALTTPTPSTLAGGRHG